MAKFGEPDANKARIYIQSSIHGDEQIHTNACVELIQTLATSGNKDVLDILDNETIWIVPMLNPDGNMFTLDDGTLWPQRRNIQTWTPTDWGLPADFPAPFYYRATYGVYGYDLNREFNPNLDFVLNPNTNNLPPGRSSESGFFVAPESRASAALFKALEPDLFLDLHMQYPTYAQSETDNGMNTLQLLAIATSDTGYTDKDGNVFPLDPEVLKLSKQVSALVYQGWIISELVVVEQGKMVSHRSKQNGHPVPLKGIDFFAQEKTYPKEACDVRAHHSTIFPVSSNQNSRPDRFGRPLRSPDTDTARQALSTDLPLLWTKGHWGSQLDRAQGPGSELGRHTGLDQNSLSQSVLCALSTCQRRRFRAFSPVSAGDHPAGRVYLPVVPADDRHRSGAPSGSGLEDGQGHRQILFGTRLRSARP